MINGRTVVSSVVSQRRKQVKFYEGKENFRKIFFSNSEILSTFGRRIYRHPLIRLYTL